MITIYDKKKDFNDLYDYVNRNISDNSCFYYTEENKRIFPKTKDELKCLFRNVPIAFISRNKGDIDGIIVVWRGIYNEVKRHYLKLNVCNKKVAKNLLTIALWNTGYELFLKVDKGSKLLSIFSDKGFKFFHDRGRELLFRRLRHVNNFIVTRDKDEEPDRGHRRK